jgi:adenylosuccinate synthase
MSCTVIVGGQFGSEGKGKVAALLASACSRPWVVRCGGPNSGHSVWYQDEQVVFRQLPTAAFHPHATLLLAAGCAVDENLLLDEIARVGLSRERVVVDPRAVLIEPADHEAEIADVAAIASTASGTNSAWIRRMRRRSNVRLAGGSKRLLASVRIAPVADLLHEQLEGDADVIVEGTQGFGLSLLHGAAYPYVTARDTSAAGFCSEVGLSPRHVDFIVVVVRTFPIRVGGNSGPLPNEIDWAEVKRLSGAPTEEPEFTSVTHRLRRVAQFDIAAVRRACRYNKPTSLAFMGLDRLDYTNRGVTNACDLSPCASQRIAWLETETSTPVEWIGTGFRTADVVRLKSITRFSGNGIGQFSANEVLTKDGCTSIQSAAD